MQSKHSQAGTVSVLKELPENYAVLPSTSKWKQLKYQRSSRTKRSRERLDLNQTSITNFFTIVDKVYKVLNDSAGKDNTFFHTVFSSESKVNQNDLGSFLNKLLEISQKNVQGPKNKNFYGQALKRFAIYMYYVGGRLLYETLHANLSHALPSITTLNRFLTSTKNPIQEGEVDFQGLAEYLDKRNLPKFIWITEDATRVNSKVEYDINSNKVMGFSFFKINSKSNYAYVITAQPASFNAPAYCLSIFGTDNKFTSYDVLSRWEQLKMRALKYGIKVIGFSSDGDTRLLKAMCINSGLPNNGTDNASPETTDWAWFHSNISIVDECHLQDTIHIITKLRTRFLKPGIVLLFGNYFASVEDLNTLIEKYKKDIHLLTKSDLRAEDKMNYSSADKMCSHLVINLLKENPEFKGTEVYLTLMRCIITAFMDYTVDIRDRLFHTWYCVFLLRILRANITRSKDFDLKNNFLTSNCYMCIELNAHNLIKLILSFRNRGNELKPEMMCLSVFSSQSCEKLFRSARSLTSTFSTVTNFSIKGLLQRIDRIKTINDTLSDLSDIFVFLREANKREREFYTPTLDELLNLDIEQVIMNCLSQAILTAKELGIEPTDEDWKNIKLLPRFETVTKKVSTEYYQDSEENSEEEIDKGTIYNEDDSKCELNVIIENQNQENDNKKINMLGLKNYSDTVQDITEDSQYVKIVIDNKVAVIKKSSYIWLLDEHEGKISNDRMRLS
nr:unnamed protein product [Callosobruchus analis]